MRWVVKKYLRESFLNPLSFLISHFYDLPDLIDERLTLTLQDELTLNLNKTRLKTPWMVLLVEVMTFQNHDVKCSYNICYTWIQATCSVFKTGHSVKTNKSKHHYHNLCNLLWVVTIKIKFEGHHLPVVRFQLALCYSVSHIRNLQNI